MSVLPPGATNSNVPPWATASSPVAHPVSSTATDTIDITSHLTPRSPSLQAPGLRIAPAHELVVREREGRERREVAQPAVRQGQMVQMPARHRPAQRLDGQLMADADGLVACCPDAGPVQRRPHPRRDL